MQINNAICNRRSIRKFLDKPIDKYKIKQIIEAGIQAPSANNLQEWRFKFLNNQEKEKIVTMGGANFIINAPLALIVFYPTSANNYHKGIQSASACIQNMLIKSFALGIGSCWVCNLPAQRHIKRLLNVPYPYDVIACVLFGYPINKPKYIKRKYSYSRFFIFKKDGSFLKYWTKKLLSFL